MEQSVVAHFAPLVLIMVVFSTSLIMGPQQKKFWCHTKPAVAAFESRR